MPLGRNCLHPGTTFSLPNCSQQLRDWFSLDFSAANSRLFRLGLPEGLDVLCQLVLRKPPGHRRLVSSVSHVVKHVSAVQQLNVPTGSVRESSAQFLERSLWLNSGISVFAVPPSAELSDGTGFWANEDRWYLRMVCVCGTEYCFHLHAWCLLATAFRRTPNSDWNAEISSSRTVDLATVASSLEECFSTWFQVFPSVGTSDVSSSHHDLWSV